MLIFTRTFLHPSTLLRSSKFGLQSTSILSSERFQGAPKPTPDPDEGQKYSPEDFKTSAGYGIPKRGDDYFDKNKKFGRPLSPHLSIYQFQLPMAMSITHRITGATLAVGLGLTSLGLLMAQQPFENYVEIIRDWHVNAYFLYLVKFGAAWSLVYHYLNGIRHLAWDYGQGFKLSQLYKSGYSVLILSIAIAAYLAVQ